MAEYINKEKLLTEMVSHETGLPTGVVKTVVHAINMRIKGFKTEYVAPVVHAHWEIDGETPYCSKCGKCPEEFFDTNGYDSVCMKHGDEAPKYCPECGAKMDEEDKNNG